MSEAEKDNDKPNYKDPIHSLVPNAAFIGFAPIQANGTVDIMALEQTPKFASVPIFIPKNKLDIHNKHNEGAKDDGEQKT